MNHEVTIVDSRRLNDGQVAVAAICCGDESTKSWHTMAVTTAADPVICQQSISQHLNRIAGQHDEMLKALAHLPGLVGTKHKIDLSAIPAAPTSTEPGSVAVAA
jgi:hypothetical protein